MPLAPNPLAIDGLEYDSRDLRVLVQSLLGSPLGLFAGGLATDTSHAVATPDALKVTPTGTASKSVVVAAGSAFIRGSESVDQGAYHDYASGSTTLLLADPDATNARYDLIGIRVRDSGESGSPVDNGATLAVLTGNPSPSPLDPTIPANFLPLARVRVGPGTSAVIDTSRITDLRRVALTAANNGQGRLTSSKDPNPRNGFVAAPLEVHPSLRCTFTPRPGRRLRVSVSGVLTLATGVAGALLDVREGGVSLGTIWQNNDITPSGHSFNGWIEIENPAPTQHTYQLFIMETGAAGTLNVAGSATFPTRMMVEDIGAF